MINKGQFDATQPGAAFISHLLMIIEKENGSLKKLSGAQFELVGFAWSIWGVFQKGGEGLQSAWKTK